MVPPRLILAPVDFSDCSRVSLDFAARLAAQCGARLHVLHAESPLLEAAAHSRHIDLAGQARTELRSFMEATHAAGSVPVYEVVAGPPAEAICEAAARHGADLIVMGPHGRSRLERALLGSTTQGVLLRAHTDVVVVPPSWTPPGPEAASLNGLGPVVVGVREPSVPDPAIGSAGSLAAALGAPLEVVHVLPEDGSGQGAEARTRGAEQALAAALPAGLAGSASVHVLHGDAGRALVEWLAMPGRKRGCLVLDRTHRRGRAELGRTTRTLLAQCQAPMFWRP